MGVDQIDCFILYSYNAYLERSTAKPVPRLTDFPSLWDRPWTVWRGSIRYIEISQCICGRCSPKYSKIYRCQARHILVPSESFFGQWTYHLLWYVYSQLIHMFGIWLIFTMRPVMMNKASFKCIISFSNLVISFARLVDRKEVKVHRSLSLARRLR